LPPGIDALRPAIYLANRSVIPRPHPLVTLAPGWSMIQSAEELAEWHFFPT
jgi:hypothetical protein